MIKAFAKTVETIALASPPSPHIELVCPVRSLSGLRTAIDNGADCVRIDFLSVPDGVHCTEQNLETKAVVQGIETAHKRGRKAVLGLDIQSHTAIWSDLRTVIDDAAQAGVDAIALSDPALILYVAMRHPGLPVHYRPPVTILNGDAIERIHAQLGVQRIVLPDALSLNQLQSILRSTTVEVEIAGVALNAATHGSRANTASQHLDTSLSNCLVGHCANDEDASNEPCYDRSSIREGTLALLPQLASIGVHAVTADICSQDPRHLARITRMWRNAIDHCLQERAL